MKAGGNNLSGNIVTAEALRFKRNAEEGLRREEWTVRQGMVLCEAEPAGTRQKGRDPEESKENRRTLQKIRIMERTIMERKVSAAVQEARKAVFPGGLSRYRAPLSRELEGQHMDLVFDDAPVMHVSFPGRNRISFDFDGRNFTEACQVQKAADGAYFIMTEIAGSSPRRGFMIVLDVFERLVTAVFAAQGEVKDFPKLVTRTVHFGAIDTGEEELPEKRACFTRDLIGKKIDWTYNPDFSIIHVYLDNNYYTVARNEEMQKRMEQMKRENPERFNRPRPNPYYEENCLYIKLRENLYLFSFVEKNSGSGTQGLMVINTDRVTDVGCFWGCNPDGIPEAYTFNAYGKWVREEIPEDHTLEKIAEKKAE